MSLKKKIFQYGLNSVMNIPARVFNWIRVRVFRKHLAFKIEGSFSDNLDLAIFVLYPGTTPFVSIVRAISSLQQSGYQVLLVLNRNASTNDWSEKLSKVTSHILTRDNIGADFGAYKAAIHYLEKSGFYTKLKNLVLVNDSIYFNQNSVEVLAEIARPSNPVNCLFFHRQSVVHAASTLLKFDRNKLDDLNFKRFWKNYYPYIQKSQIIRKGEQSLTSKCGQNYFKPFVESKNLLNHNEVKNMKPAERMQLIKWAYRSLGSSFGEFDLYCRNMPDHKLIEYGIYNFQVSNSLGLYLTRVYKVPIKLDLVKLDLIQMSDYKELLQAENVSESEIDALLGIIALKGSSLSSSYLERLLK